MKLTDLLVVLAVKLYSNSGCDVRQYLLLEARLEVAVRGLNPEVLAAVSQGMCKCEVVWSFVVAVFRRQLRLLHICSGGFEDRM